MVVDSQETAQTRLLSVDRTIGSTWLVTQGLEPGERVIVEGLQFARPGTPVRPVPWEESGADGRSGQTAPAQPSSETRNPRTAD